VKTLVKWGLHFHTSLCECGETLVELSQTYMTSMFVKFKNVHLIQSINVRQYGKLIMEKRQIFSLSLRFT
jgi:hypothetical protein